MQTGAIKVRGEIPFPLAGEGVMLLFRNSDLKLIEQDLGVQWFNETIDQFLSATFTMERIEYLLRHSIKVDRKPFDPGEDFWENYAPHEAAETVFDAVCLAMRGKTAKEYVEEMYAAFREAEESGEVPSPLSPDSTTSTISDESASGPESE